MRQPWSCACGARGEVRHTADEESAVVMARIAEAHAIASIDCAIERAERGISVGAVIGAAAEEQLSLL